MNKTHRHEDSPTSSNSVWIEFSVLLRLGEAPELFRGTGVVGPAGRAHSLLLALSLLPPWLLSEARAPREASTRLTRKAERSHLVACDIISFYAALMLILHTTLMMSRERALASFLTRLLAPVNSASLNGWQLAIDRELPILSAPSSWRAGGAPRWRHAGRACAVTTPRPMRRVRPPPAGACACAGLVRVSS